MNGLCPACRRQYRDEDIEYKVITPEETAAHKARQTQKQKKTQAALQKEKQKAEADNLSRKHLAGLRVVQKNLVYVTGLSPSSQEDQLLQTLRGDQYFGQYGRIIKIVVSKAKDPSHPQSVGVYVTYERKEDAAKCIAAVDGSRNGERTLRAQFGTTKYCSAYLRGETCTNRNCMFLHEPGEANESYSRADLSALNAGSSQHGAGRAPPPQSQQPVASAAQPSTNQSSEDVPPSPTLARPALPSTASWASKPPLQKAESQSQSATEASTSVSNPPAPTPEEPVQDTQPATEEPSPVASVEVAEPALPKPSSKRDIAPLLSLLKSLNVQDFRLVWSPTSLSPGDLEIINNYPPLFDTNGGAKRRLRRQQEEHRRRITQESQNYQHPPTVDPDEPLELGSGSLQLGGEPEDRPNLGQLSSAMHPAGQDGGLDQHFQFGGSASSPGVNEHGLTPQQHQQQPLLQALKTNAQDGYSGNHPQSANFQSSFPQQQQSNAPGHQRNVSRFSFANDSGSASTAVKPVANPKLMNQQSSMMPPASGNHFGAQHQQPPSQFYTSNVQGPPPGLKTTGTPPVSGNLTFGQGHGFATGGLQYGAGTSRNQQDNYYRELLRRDGAVSGVDAKRELHSFPSYNSHQSAGYPASQSNAFPAQPYGSLTAFGDGEKQRKKKGKKHRHANTSSSSGGGVVDVTDPSTSHLLQTRLHQGAGNLNGGAFAGQAGAAPGGLYSVMHGGGYGGRW